MAELAEFGGNAVDFVGVDAFETGGTFLGIVAEGVHGDGGEACFLLFLLATSIEFLLALVGLTLYLLGFAKGFLAALDVCVEGLALNLLLLCVKAVVAAVEVEAAGGEFGGEGE